MFFILYGDSILFLKEQMEGGSLKEYNRMD
jgi:hypothetical protein